MNNTFYPLKIESGRRSISGHRSGLYLKYEINVCYCWYARCQMSYYNKSLSRYSDFRRPTSKTVRNLICVEYFYEKHVDDQKNSFPNIIRIGREVYRITCIVLLVDVEFSIIIVRIHD